METNYFLIINGQQVGPLELHRLREAGLTPDTPVWRAGLADWVKASTLPELEVVLAAPVEVEPPRPGNQTFDPNPPYGSQRPYGMQQEPYGQQQPYGAQQPYGQQQPYGRPAGFNAEPPYGNGLPIAHTNWLPWAIVGTVLGALCCFIGMVIGIIGIVNASKANRFYNEGNQMQGDSANSTARTTTIISLVLGALGIPISAFVLSDALSTMQTLVNGI